MNKQLEGKVIVPPKDLEARIVRIVKREGNSTKARNAAMAALAAQELVAAHIAPTADNITRLYRKNRPALEAKLNALLEVN